MKIKISQLLRVRPSGRRGEASEKNNILLAYGTVASTARCQSAQAQSEKVRFYRKSVNYDLELNDELKEIITGLMLGYLFADKSNPNSNTRLQFKQSIKNKEYIEHLYSLFKDYCNSEPKVNSSVDNRPGSAHAQKELNVSIKFWTQSLPCFNQFRELFYDDSGNKFIPLNLESLISAKSLAYWAMDDGYKTTNGFYFCTESYTLEDNHKLSKILKNRFNLDCGFINILTDIDCTYLVVLRMYY